MKLFFRFGTHPNLSYAEIMAYFALNKIGYLEEYVDQNVLIVDTQKFSEYADYANLINELGGTVKVGEIILETNHPLPSQAVARTSQTSKFKMLRQGVGLAPSLENKGGGGQLLIAQSIFDVLSKVAEKKYFGLSLINREYSPFKSKKQLESFGLSIKKELTSPSAQDFSGEALGVTASARFVTSKEPELSSVIVAKEKLLTNGGDFNLIYSENKVYLGLTKAVQDFKAYSYRDFGRPAFDSKSGMLPPKVAQIMINLTKTRKDAVVWDPFCGSGTVLQELLVKGYTNVIGSDLSAKAVADSKTNLDWIAKKDGLDISKLEIFQADATKMSSIADSSAFAHRSRASADEGRGKALRMTTSVDAIVTEPFLGPALRGSETKDQGIKIRKELEQLYIDSFKEFKKVLIPGGVVVIIVPSFKVKEGIVNLNIIEPIKKLGFELKTDFKNIEGLKFRYPLMYYREDQRVLREVLVFKLK